MRRTVQVLLAIIMLSVAVLIIIDSQRIVDTGTGNGAAILWDNEFENFVSSLPSVLAVWSLVVSTLHHCPSA